jgi:hypothetical protein
VNSPSERSEQEMRIDLRSERFQLGLGREPLDFLLAQLAVVSFLRQADRIDPPRDRHGNRLERRHVVGQEAASAHQRAADDRVVWRIAGGDVHRGHSVHNRHEGPGRAIGRDPGCVTLGPAHGLTTQRGRDLLAQIVEQRGDLVVGLCAGCDSGSQGSVVGTAEHDRVDEPGHAPIEPWEQERRAHPERHHQADFSRAHDHEIARGLEGQTNAGDGQKRGGNEREDGQRPFEKQIGERERIILVQDRQCKGQ